MNSFFQSIGNFFRNLFGIQPKVENPITPPPIVEPVKPADVEIKSEIKPTPTIEEEIKPVQPETPPHPPIIEEPKVPEIPKSHPTEPIQPDEAEGFALQLHLERYSLGEKDTLGKLSINGKFYAYTLEDVHASKGKSAFKFGVNDDQSLTFNCISSGKYEVALRAEGGGMHTTYSLKYPDFHKGMLHLLNVPKQNYVFFQIGTTEADTKGCIILGESIENEEAVSESRLINGSENAYKMVYPLVLEYLNKGGKVYLTITE